MLFVYYIICYLFIILCYLLFVYYIISICLLTFIVFIAICLFSSCETLSNLPGMTTTGIVTEADAGQGIKEALAQGAASAIVNLNKENAFFGSDVYKMFLPADAQKIESTLRKLGMGKQVDKLGAEVVVANVEREREPI